MQIKPCREAFMAGFEGSDGAGRLDTIALIESVEEVRYENSETK